MDNALTILGRVTPITVRDLAAARDAILDEFAVVGVRGLLHAVDIDTGHEIGVNSDELVVTASVFKLPILVELCRQYTTGRRTPVERIRIAAGEYVVPGSTGIAPMLDDVELSLRDLAFLMMSVSDNRATDVIADLVGLDAVNATLRTFGLERTTVEVDCRGIFRSIEEDLGMSLEQLDAAVRADEGGIADRIRGLSCSDPAATDRTTPREITTLLAAVWRDEVIGADAAAEVRRILGQQAWPHRLMAGFPDSRIRVSGKTGTIFGVRNEAGVVEYPTGERFAIGVFLQEPWLEQRNPDADRVIGTAARIATDYLRESQTAYPA